MVRFVESKSKKKNTVPIVPFNFVAHLTYPHEDKIKEVLFLQNVMKIKHRVTRDGQFIMLKQLDGDFIEFLIKSGYDVESVKVESPNVYRSIGYISIKCGNKNCPYFKENVKGENLNAESVECKIKIKAAVEMLSRSKKYVANNRQIVINFNAREFAETTKKMKCIRKYMYDKTGIIGDPDTYGRIGMC